MAHRNIISVKSGCPSPNPREDIGPMCFSIFSPICCPILPHMGVAGLQGRWKILRAPSQGPPRIGFRGFSGTPPPQIWIVLSGLEKVSQLFHLIFQIFGLCLEPGIWDSKAKNMTPLLSTFCWFFLPWSMKDRESSCLVLRKQGIPGKTYGQILPVISHHTYEAPRRSPGIQQPVNKGDWYLLCMAA